MIAQLSGDTGHRSRMFSDITNGISLIVGISHIPMINQTVMEI